MAMGLFDRRFQFPNLFPFADISPCLLRLSLSLSMATFQASFFFLLRLLSVAVPSHSVCNLRRPIKAFGGAVQPMWCVGKNSAEDDVLEHALNSFCGPGGAVCVPIQQGGSRFSKGDPDMIELVDELGF